MDDTSLLFELLQQTDADRPFSDEDEKRLQILAKTEKETRREKRKEKRLQDCGNWSHWFNPHNGRRKSFIFRCELFRECEKCLEHRGVREREWIKDASLKNDKIIIRASRGQIDHLLRNKYEGKKIEKSNYVRYPQENGGDILIIEKRCIITIDKSIDTSTWKESKELRLGWVLSQNWTEIVNTPKGRNKSGTVHYPISDENIDDFTLITTKQFTTDANRPRVVKAMREAEEETRELDPRTPDQVVKALNRRINIATSKLKEDGYNVQVYNKRLRVIHSKIDWQDRGVNNRVNTEKTTSSLNPNGSIEIKQFEP